VVAATERQRRCTLKALKIAILGAGNGAQAMAGHLGMDGFSIRLYSKFTEEIEPFQKRKGVRVEGVINGFGPVELATTDPVPVVSWADVIMVVVPAFVHRLMAQMCAPLLHDGQIVILNPGRTGGALEFAAVLQENGLRARVRVAEAQSLVYACRISGPGRVHISGIKRQVPLAAFPAAETSTVLETAGMLYPQFTPASDVLETSFDNIGAVFHPSTVVLNANRIEAGEDFEFYRSMTPAVAQFLEAVDKERLAVARAFGVKVESARDWLRKTYTGVIGETLHACIQSNAAYRGIMAPKSLKVRYILEDVPTGLVPLASLGALANVPTPACRAVTDICCVLIDRDLWTEGRTVQNLGLAGMSVDQIRAFVNTGSRV